LQGQHFVVPGPLNQGKTSGCLLRRNDGGAKNSFRVTRKTRFLEKSRFSGPFRQKL
jgi:hypothetical protein